ncbi:MAG: M20/M25/M40 family metallo-hydrolase [Pyrinomonadaceae bacterium]
MKSGSKAANAKKAFMFRKSLNISLIVALALSAVFAQQPADTHSVERLRAHITHLASDKLEGRRTGGAGANLAAEYIAGEFARYGLQRSIGWDTPGMAILEADSPNRYLQKFPYVAGVKLGKQNVLSIQGPGGPSVDLRVGVDWMPLGFSAKGTLVDMGVVFVGYGITASELKHDDYAGANVANKIAVALSGTPDGENPHGQFARYEGVQWKTIAARHAGAKALIVIARDKNFTEDRLSKLRVDHGGSDVGLPVMTISRPSAEKLFQLAQSSLQESASQANNKSHRPKELSGILLEVSIDIIRHEVEASNVIGIVNGSDPVLKKETIVIGAHYDHLGRGGEGSLAPRAGDIHHGADDNASGTAGLLELARIFASAEGPRPRRTIVFIAFSGEEEGLLGSNYYVNHPLKPLENTVAMINMDMIGRMKNNKLVVGGVGTAEGLKDLVNRSNTDDVFTPTSASNPVQAITRGSNETPVFATNDELVGSLKSHQAFDLTLSEDGFGPSDHSSFYAKKIPVLFLWTGTHEDYHKPSDTADKINYVDEAQILGFVERIVRGIDANNARPAYTVAKNESQGRTTGFRVYIGTIPNYADSGAGLLLDGVRDDSPAAKAGIKAGDRIVKLAGREVRNVYDYTYALGEMKAGQEYEVELVRGGERIKVKLTPAARK